MQHCGLQDQVVGDTTCVRWFLCARSQLESAMDSITLIGQNCGHSYRVVDVGSLDGVLTSLIAMLDGCEVGSAEKIARGLTPARKDKF